MLENYISIIERNDKNMTKVLIAIGITLFLIDLPATIKKLKEVRNRVNE